MTAHSHYGNEQDRVSVWIFPGYGETARFYLDLKMHESFLR